MALVKCKECGKEISDKAVTCPNCGCPTSVESNIASSTNKESESEQYKFPDTTIYRIQEKKDSKAAIVGCILDIIAFFSIGFLSIGGVICGLIDITSDDPEYRHVFGWISLIVGIIFFILWIKMLILL